MTRTAHALAFLVVFIWGFNFIVIRWGMEAMHPMTMTALRFLLTAVPLVFFIKKPDVPMRYVVIYGVLFGSGVWCLTNLAIALGTPAGMASLLLQLSPFLTVLVAVFGFGERLSRVQILGIIIAFIGFITICLPQIQQPSALGMGLVLLAAVCWTVCNVIIKHSKPKNVISFTVWSSVFVPVPIVVLSAVYALFYPLDWHTFITIDNYQGIVSVLFQAGIVTLFGYGVWTHLISRYGLSVVAPYTLLVPIFGVFFGGLFYDETLSTIEIVGAGLVLAGLVLLMRKSA
ncbi:EamA family transporter [Psychrobacter aestuarii]|uniref:EamA family transporter n=1 Tax=Psychrobacter aestuarii TaxID=556327 RepID=A0ABN0VPP2_9GAMM|nr:EamA family transporter [Psychrobacter aestuarii]